MHKSSSEILREYAKIVSEGDLGNPHNNTAQEPNDFPEDGGIDLPDESMMDQSISDDAQPEQVSNGDPVEELAAFLNTDSNKISEFLKKNNLELTPTGGLSNSDGKV